MPYITQDRRTEFEVYFPHKLTCGDLNYMITKLCCGYMEQHGLSYQTINDILGALDGASKEFYRRIAIPYENTKITANGDVYPVGTTDAMWDVR